GAQGLGFGNPLFDTIPIEASPLARPGIDPRTGNLAAQFPQAVESPLAAMQRRAPPAKPAREEWAARELPAAENLRRMFAHATTEPQALVDEAGRAIERGDVLLQQIVDEKRMGISDHDILHGSDGKHGILASLDPNNETSGRFA